MARHDDHEDDDDDGEDARLDKWLWAARFFKTRTIAKAEIDAGHVRYEGERTKPAKQVAIGALLSIRQGYDQIEVEVRGLSNRRGPAPQARLLYEETPASCEKRRLAAEERRAANSLFTPDRPTKQQRRLIHRFKRSLS